MHQWHPLPCLQNCFQSISSPLNKGEEINILHCPVSWEHASQRRRFKWWTKSGRFKFSPIQFITESSHGQHKKSAQIFLYLHVPSFWPWGLHVPLDVQHLLWLTEGASTLFFVSFVCFGKCALVIQKFQMFFCELQQGMNGRSCFCCLFKELIDFWTVELGANH